jgi:hypothetical protein
LLRAELDRLRRRLVLALELIREVEAERAAALAATADDAVVQKITALQRIRGIGANFSSGLHRRDQRLEPMGGEKHDWHLDGELEQYPVWRSRNKGFP